MFFIARTGQNLLQQINVQRGLLVRDFPCCWLLLIDPQSRQRWYSVALDFCDFLALLVESALPETGLQHGLLIVALSP